MWGGLPPFGLRFFITIAVLIAAGVAGIVIFGRKLVRKIRG